MITSAAATAHADQLTAATTDALKRLTAVAEHHRSPLYRDPLPPWLWPHVERAATALLHGTGPRCPHLSAAPAVAHSAVWAPGHLVCGPCVRTLVPDAREDTTCDRCRRPAEPIHAGALAFGPLLLAFGLCDPCLTHTEHRPARKGTRR